MLTNPALLIRARVKGLTEVYLVYTISFHKCSRTAC